MNDTSNVGSIIEDLNHKADLKFLFSALLHKTITGDVNYGNGEVIKMLDAHILKDIEENPGILSTELAKRWCRARSAICVIIQRLEYNGYIRKEKSDDNKKEIGLFPTKKGHEMCRAHKSYDAARTGELLSKLLQFCTAEEIDAFFKVLECQIGMMQEGYMIGDLGSPIFMY